MRKRSIGTSGHCIEPPRGDPMTMPTHWTGRTAEHNMTVFSDFLSVYFFALFPISMFSFTGTHTFTLRAAR